MSSPCGIVAGQAWESEREVPLARYHRAKTSSLFEAAVAAGAIAGGGCAEPWGEFGARLGDAYQIADDLLDASGDVTGAGKPGGRDAARGRPNLALERGRDVASARFERAVADALHAIPECPGREALTRWSVSVALRLLPGRGPQRAMARAAAL